MLLVHALLITTSIKPKDNENEMNPLALGTSVGLKMQSLRTFERLRILGNLPISSSRSYCDALSEFPPDTTSGSLASSLQRYINSECPVHGQKIHAHILKSGVEPNTNIWIKLLILHLKSGCLDYARKLFEEIPKRTLSAYNYMLSGNVKAGDVGEFSGLFSRMVVDGGRADGYTLSMMLKMSTCRNSGVHLPRNVCGVVHGMIFRLSVEFDDVLCTALVDSYVKHAKVGYARTVFDMMLEKNVVCATSMITGYMNRGSMEEAEEIFGAMVEKDIVVYNAMIEGYSKMKEYAERSVEIYIEMQRASFHPNISTFASVIGACALLTSYEFGLQIHTQIMKSPLLADIKIGSAIVDMYAKCGRVEDARRIFDWMPNKNVFSWSSMIDGYGKNGEPRKALDLFNKMADEHGRPNSVTFLGTLSACAHAGLVAEGREIFNSMERDYSVRPSMEHYACMVDLLGRAGSVRDAWEFVMGMREKPSEDVWAALLSACRLYGEVEMARVAADELFKLRADGRPGAYVALSNTLADAGKWDNVSELRELMKVRGISKGGACSWVAADCV